MTETQAAVDAAKKVKSPILNMLEKAVFDRCRETGDSAEAALLNDPGVHMAITELVKKQVTVEKVQLKLNNDVVWLQRRVVAVTKAAGIDPFFGDEAERASHEHQAADGEVRG